MLISKSDYKLSRSCLTKLKYKKKGYLSNLDENEYLEYLAEGGYLVSKLAQLYYKNGITISTINLNKAIEDTKNQLLKDSVILFEATFKIDRLIAAVDILEKTGDTINIIEVKSSGYRDKKDLKNLKDEIEDIAFQKIIIEELYPDHHINTYLFLPNKLKHTSIDNLFSRFKIDSRAVIKSFKNIEVSYNGDIDELVRDDLMIKVDVGDEVERIIDDVKNHIDLTLQYLDNIDCIKPKLSKECFKCEYNVESERSGYNDCWSDHTLPLHHLKDVYQFTRKTSYIEKAIIENNLSMFDIPEDILIGSYGVRQQIQIENTKKNIEWFSDNLKNLLDSFTYPLHFIDFETIRTAIPFHNGMKPYDMICFQWSCHSILQKGQEPMHYEWINVDRRFPSFEFAKSLMDLIGTTGTVFMWSNHEKTTLSSIHNHLYDMNYKDQELEDWLKYMTGSYSPLVDMNKITLENYFHPDMKGRTSIKVTLPAVLKSNRSDRTIRWLKEFDNSINLYSLDEEGNIDNPYKNLPLIQSSKESKSISEGTAAMISYIDILYGNPEDKENIKTGLLNYCKLDTLAMLVIWEHWCKLVNLD